MNNKIIIGICALMIIVGGLILWNNQPEKEIASDNSSAVLLSSEKMNLEERGVMMDAEEEGKSIEKNPQEKKLISTENVEKIILEVQKGYEGNAVATRLYDGEIFYHTVTADIGDPASGKFYEGWLVDEAKFFSTGKMELVNGEYHLEYSSDDDKGVYAQVVITEETLADGLDNKPEAHVFEGKF